MAKVVNLNKFRKDKARAERAKQADENRVAYGRTKQEKQIAREEEERREKALDGHSLDDDKDGQ